MIGHDTGLHSISGPSHCSLTVKTTAWKFLRKRVNPYSDVLVLTWGGFDDSSEQGWRIRRCLWEDLPAATLAKSYHWHLKDYRLVIAQPQHIGKLDGCQLYCHGDDLIIEQREGDVAA